VRLGFDAGPALEADVALVCAGRRANIDGLGLEALGVKTGKKGQVEVDAQFRTTVPTISAAGDVIGFPSLASTSMEQARVAVVHMFDLKYKTKIASVFPYGIFTIPEISMAGETEETLRARGVEYVKGVAELAHNARGVIIGDDGALKLLFRRDDMKLLGVHIIGEGATELIHVGLSALMHGATAEHFIDLCFNYPSLSEAYKYATYDALGQRERKVTGTG
jgi:NAD(P) transhydrogenase